MEGNRCAVVLSLVCPQCRGKGYIYLNSLSPEMQSLLPLFAEKDRWLIREVMDRLGLNRGAASALLKRARALGFVERCASGRGYVRSGRVVVRRMERGSVSCGW